MFKENRTCNLYRRATGSVNKKSVVVDGSGTSVAAGNLLTKNTTDADTLVAFTNAGAVAAIALEASSAATTKIEVDLILPGDALIADVETGTPAANDIGVCDGTSANPHTTVDVTEHSSDDFIFFYIGSTTEVLLYPNHYMVGGNVAYS